MNSLDRPLISIHFPKAAGSSFSAALVAAFGEPAVHRPPHYDCDPLDPANPLWVCPNWFLRRRPHAVKPYSVVHGHQPIVRYDLLPSAYRVVILREPVDNLISIYYYWKTLFDTEFAGHSVFEFVKKERLSLLEVAEIPSRLLKKSLREAESERNTPIKPESKDERMGIAAAELTIENHFSTAC
jgi:hypothetical protein